MLIYNLEELKYSIVDSHACTGKQLFDFQIKVKVVHLRRDPNLQIQICFYLLWELLPTVILKSNSVSVQIGKNVRLVSHNISTNSVSVQISKNVRLIYHNISPNSVSVSLTSRNIQHKLSKFCLASRNIQNNSVSVQITSHHFSTNKLNKCSSHITISITNSVFVT